MTELWGKSQYTPPPAPRREVGEGMSASDASHRDNMRRGSETLRDRIIGLLADREAKFSAQVDLHEEARAAIKAGWLKEQVRHRFGLSNTAYEQLAAQVARGLL